MLFTISIFFFSVAVAFALISRKVWQFRTGRIVPGGYEEADWTDLSIESVRMRLAELAKFSIHHIVLFALKVWIISSNLVKKTDKKVKQGLVKVLHTNAHYPAGGKPSSFLKNIKDHKDEMANTLHKETIEE